MVENKPRDQHKPDVASFMQKNVSNQTWNIQLPPYGTGQETYIAQTNRHKYFIKLGAELERYQIMSELGFSPKVIVTGRLENGITVLVQEFISGRVPLRSDFQENLKKIAETIRDTHQSGCLKRSLSGKTSRSFKDVGFEIINQVEGRWEKYRYQVPKIAKYVDEKIIYLKEEVSKFSGGGLIASHNDICNGNWLITDDGRIYLLDYEGMSLDDPALDIGAILWWYYPPQMRKEFVEILGYDQDENFPKRMRIRMAIHNLHIIIPRENSFDRFSAGKFEEILTDFRAVIEGRENPQGYNDKVT